MVRTMGHTIEDMARDAGVTPASESNGIRKYWIADICAAVAMVSREGLMAARKAGAVTLGRADLVPHWGTETVAASELEVLPGVRVHFLVVRD